MAGQVGWAVGLLRRAGGWSVGFSVRPGSQASRWVGPSGFSGGQVVWAAKVSRAGRLVGGLLRQVGRLLLGFSGAQVDWAATL